MYKKNNFTIQLKTKKILELEKAKDINIEYQDYSNKPLVGFFIKWFRGKLVNPLKEKYIKKIIHKQMIYNNLVYEFIKELYEENIELKRLLKKDENIIDKNFFDKEYFESGTKSTYIDYSKHIEVFKEFSKIIYHLFTPKKALDVGCAYGYLVKYLRVLNVKAYGIDISKFAINKGNMPYLKLGNVLNLEDFADNSFELIICTEVLEHIRLEDLDTAIKELVRVSSNYILLTIAVKEYERNLDLSHVSVFPREFWDKKFKLHKLKRDIKKESYLSNLPFSKKTGWVDHYFVLKVNK